VTSHTQVLLCLAHDPDVRLIDVAQTVGITERAAQRIVTDLVEAGYVRRTRIGRRNRYTVNPNVEMRHQSQHGHAIGDLLNLLRLDTAPGSKHARSVPRTPVKRGRGEGKRSSAS
jgi:DNA-binding IclR family transcriptional regulator